MLDAEEGEIGVGDGLAGVVGGALVALGVSALEWVMGVDKI